MKKALTIAGSDCSGGAGIQADLKTFAAHGVFGMSAVISVVAENTCRVTGVQNIAPDIIEKQIDAVYEDIVVDAVKVGMLSSSECILAVERKILQYRPENLVIDPVMYAKGGAALMEPSALGVYINKIIPLAGLLTPNIPEAEQITGMKIVTTADMEQAAKIIVSMGCKAALVKGGHTSGDAVDVLFDGKSVYHFSSERIDTKNTHGTGCTFSSAIAANLALGYSLYKAVERAKLYITGAIRNALPIGKGHGPTNHFYDVYKNGLTEDVL